MPVPAPIFALALTFSVSVNPCEATVDTALKLPTLPNPTCVLVTSCGLFLLAIWLIKSVIVLEILPKATDNFSPLVSLVKVVDSVKVGVWSFVATLGTLLNPTSFFVTL